MSSFKPIDGSKEDFRKYLDRKGVLDAITKVLIKCNSDRPENAIEYLLDNLGEKLKDKDTIARLENELNDARNENEKLKREMRSMKVSISEGSQTNKQNSSEQRSLEKNIEFSEREDFNGESLVLETAAHSVICQKKVNAGAVEFENQTTDSVDSVSVQKCL